MIEKNIIFMGQPGAGKGTVASILTSETDLYHLSTGNIFRQEISNQTPLGLQVKEIVSTGGYVPDDITNAIVKNAITKLNQENKHFILDGYPRTIDQAKFLKSLDNYNFLVIELRVDQDAVIERLSGRRTCPACNEGYHIKFKPPVVSGKCDKDNSDLILREDDSPERVIHRLNVYKEQTAPLLNYYQNNNELIIVDASDTPQNVAKKVLEIIQNNGKI
ncbi:adenylate kinase [Mycoplasma sp. NEAQ87857]|uniref:adenylate kinase family protein n=1 Tax=Mycoplasma sp. NEAQ87857 TaxID=2683967 RepID=UPI0013160136|nr:nucleoside monophosphate kinase [Mycoplasma sp. NEAQ87857]QGZ97457.1 adenylate kinase [Mycoplasma sp. NEAQ87857]